MHLEAKVTNSTSQSFANDTFRLCQIRKCLVNTPCSAFQISLDQNSVSWNFKLPSHRDAICVRFLLCPDVVGQMKRCHQVSGSSFSLCVSGCEMGMSAAAGDCRTHCWPCLGYAGTFCRDLQGWGHQRNLPQSQISSLQVSTPEVWVMLVQLALESRSNTWYILKSLGR